MSSSSLRSSPPPSRRQGGQEPQDQQQILIWLGIPLVGMFLLIAIFGDDDKKSATIAP
jgi:hypothetical protein